MKELLLIGVIFVVLPVAIFLPPHLIIWVAKGLFNIDWAGKYWLVFTGWLLLGALFNGSKSNSK